MYLNSFYMVTAEPLLKDTIFDLSILYKRQVLQDHGFEEDNLCITVKSHQN